MWARHNENPDGRNVGDCTVRAISTALKQNWETTYVGLSLQGFLMGDMPSANHVWGAYLREMGFRRAVIPDECPDCYPAAPISCPCPVMWCVSWTGTITTPGTPAGRSLSITGVRRNDP